MSCEVPGEEPLPGARYNAEKLSKFFRRANVPTKLNVGGKLTLESAKEDINDLFSKHCEVHVLYGIFHGHKGSWKLSDYTTLGLRDILEQWDVAKELGTAQHLLIVSDACQSGHMVNEMVIEDFLWARGDVAVQASCSPCNPTYDTAGETFTELLLWKLQGQKMKRGRDKRICSIEMALLNFGPCYYCPDRSNYRGWIFVDEDGSDQSSQIFSLEADSSDTTSQGLSSAEPDGAPSFPQPDNDASTHRAGRIQVLVFKHSRQAPFRQARSRESQAIFLLVLLLLLVFLCFLHRLQVDPGSSLIHFDLVLCCCAIIGVIFCLCFLEATAIPPWMLFLNMAFLFYIYFFSLRELIYET